MGRAKPADKDIKRLIINMERWRWMPEELGAVYVWNNSPEFKLYVVKDGKPIFGDKTLVGTIGYATPVFTSPHDHHRLQSRLDRARDGGEGEHLAAFAAQGTIRSSGSISSR